MVKVCLQEINMLRFDLEPFRPDVRRLFDMHDVLYDRKLAARRKENPDIYYMYRGLSLKPQDKKIMLDRRIRYDVTVLLPIMLGKEFPKTVGHYHPQVSPGYSYTEVYQVLEGEAHWLIQRRNGTSISDVACVTAKEGDVFIIPPNYGHVSINPTKQPLIMANWVADNFSSDYKPIAEKGGAAYFEAVGGFVENLRYGNVPGLRFLKQVDVFEVEDMYDLIKTPEKLDFLNFPQKFDVLWDKILK